MLTASHPLSHPNMYTVLGAILDLDAGPAVVTERPVGLALSTALLARPPASHSVVEVSRRPNTVRDAQPFVPTPSPPAETLCG